MKLTDLFSSKSLSKKETGDLGEELAARRLKRLGYKIIERNFSVHRVGEIDIIAMDGEYLCFVEVRLRSRTDYGTPAETVTAEKRRRVARAAEIYSAHNGLERALTRFDVVEVYAGAGRPKIEVIKDAFRGDWV